MKKPDPAPEPIRNPGKEWLTDKFRGLRRQLLDALNIREQRHPGSMFRGAPNHAAVERRHARNKVARRTRVRQGMARRGKR